MAVTHQFVASRQEAFAGYAKDRAHEVGEVEVGYRYDLALRVADWASTQPYVLPQCRRRYAYAALEHELPRRIEWPQVRDEPRVGTFPLAAETRDDENFLAEHALVRRDNLEMRVAAPLDLEQGEAGGKVAGNDASLHLVAVRQRHHGARRALNHVVDGDDEAVVADQCAGAAPVGAESDCHRRMVLRNLAVDADRCAGDLLENRKGSVHYKLRSALKLAGLTRLIIFKNNHCGNRVSASTAPLTTEPRAGCRKKCRGLSLPPPNARGYQIADRNAIAR